MTTAVAAAVLAWWCWRRKRQSSSHELLKVDSKVLPKDRCAAGLTMGAL